MKKILFLLLMPFLMATSCENDDEQIFCTTEAKAGLNVTIVDSQTQIPLIENVTVTATDGNYSENLELIPGNEYVFAGAYERQGNYILTVSKPNYQAYLSNSITVTADVCHVIPQQIVVNLVAE